MGNRNRGQFRRVPGAPTAPYTDDDDNSYVFHVELLEQRLAERFSAAFIRAEQVGLLQERAGE
jgi:hypothetical protein